MTRQDRKDARRYRDSLAVACQETRLDYRNAGTPSVPYFEPALPNALGRQVPDTGVAIFAGQRRASGKDLAPLPRYTA